MRSARGWWSTPAGTWPGSWSSTRTEGRTVTVLPGTVLDDVNVAAAAHGLRVGPDPSTHSRCTVGGMIGNNACGAHRPVGTTAQATLGLEVVTADGRRGRVGDLRGPDGSLAADRMPPDLQAAVDRLVAMYGDVIRRELPPWPRRVSGYGLDWLLPERGGRRREGPCGSEGTCAVVTAATLHLVRPPRAAGLLVVAFTDDIAAAAAVPALLAEHPFTVESLTGELLAGWRDPGLLPPGGAWLLLEAGGDDVTGCAITPRAWPPPSGPGWRQPAGLTTTRARRRCCGGCVRTGPAGRHASPTDRPPGPASRTAPCRRTTSPTTCASCGRCCAIRTCAGSRSGTSGRAASTCAWGSGWTGRAARSGSAASWRPPRTWWSRTAARSPASTVTGAHAANSWGGVLPRAARGLRD